MDADIREIIEGVSNTQGENFIQSITEQLARIVKADYTFVAKLDVSNFVSRTVSMAVKGKAGANMVYSLAGTPCANVIGDSVCCYPSKVVDYFPNDQLLIDMGIEAYLGAPLYDSKGKVFGLIVALYEKEINDENRTLTLFQIFSGRISAELERKEYEDKLLALNEKLEENVIERTAQLTDALDKLKATQDQLIESEKNAALGELVAGVAHEINTPLGIAITAQSFMADRLHELIKKIEIDDLSMQDMKHFQKDMLDSLTIQECNLNRAKLLVENFKKTASDQHDSVLENIDLKDYYLKVISTLKPLLREKKVDISVCGKEEIIINTYPGVHAQILTNLVTNSIKHGFDKISNNKIVIELVDMNNGSIVVIYKDNGKGLNKEQSEKIFLPFYTTARSEGGTGLGMSIVYNLITQNLNGMVKTVKGDNGFFMEFSCQKK